MRARQVGLIVVSILIGLVCVRLGFWQLGRLAERRAHNAMLASRRFSPPSTLAELPGDAVAARFRRITASGRYDYNGEIVWAFRTRNGSPGVNILTPFLAVGADTAVMVNRGWVYSPDAATIELSRWRESDTATIDGYVQPFQLAADGADLRAPRTFRAIDHATVTTAVGRPVRPYYIVLTTRPGADSARIPPRITAVTLDEGSHKSYALQWFAFASIAFVGALIIVKKIRG